MFPKYCLRISAITAAILSALWPADGANAAGRDLVIGVTTVSKALDPMGSNANVNERISNNLIETLLRIDPKTAKIGPGLAESWTLESDGALTLKIRQGVKCHNGEDFNAEDVAYMFGPARYMGKKRRGMPWPSSSWARSRRSRRSTRTPCASRSKSPIRCWKSGWRAG